MSESERKWMMGHRLQTIYSIFGEMRLRTYNDFFAFYLRFAGNFLIRIRCEGIIIFMTTFGFGVLMIFAGIFSIF